MLEIYNKFMNLNSNRTIKALIGISGNEFNEILPHFSVAYEKMREEKVADGELKRTWKCGPGGILDTDEKRLFFVLFYLKTYPTFDVLGFHFGISGGGAHDYLKIYIPVLKRTLDDMNLLPTNSVRNPDKFIQLIEKYEEINIDCTEIPYIRPSDKDVQSEYYSGKKKRHTIKLLTISDDNKKIIFSGDIHAGSVHDYTIMKDTFDIDISWFSNVKVNLDLGFMGADKDYGANIFLPHKKPRKSKNNPLPTLTDRQKKENKEHSRSRIVVENAIGGMKAFFCLTDRIRNHSADLINQFVGVSAGLWNLKIS